MKDERFIHTLLAELDWLQLVIDQVMRSYLVQEGHEQRWFTIAPPDLSTADGPYAATLHHWQPDLYTRLALALAMAPAIRPELLDVFLAKNQLYDRRFSEFGGITDMGHSGVLPTGQTFCFLVAATEPGWRTEVLRIFDPESPVIKDRVIELQETPPQVPEWNGLLSMNKDWLRYFLTGEMPDASLRLELPVAKISTSLEWSDMILDRLVMEQLKEVNTWLQYGPTLMQDWGLGRKMKPGYRCLFYGPKGTGKTLAATLTGKSIGRDVYKISLSLLIHETPEKSAQLFDTAQHHQWILLLEEGDALLDKKNVPGASDDRHVNRQIAYLLQKMEDYAGVIILVSDLEAGIDEAFARRFQNVIHFTMPTAAERYQLWVHAFSGDCTLHPDIDLHRIAAEYELTGGAIINVLRHCMLHAIQRRDMVVLPEELQASIRRVLR